MEQSHCVEEAKYGKRPLLKKRNKLFQALGISLVLIHIPFSLSIL